jgi:4-amino-4-deoxy-L-arabinose transferase-like glycosyltransferase
VTTDIGIAPGAPTAPARQDPRRACGGRLGLLLTTNPALTAAFAVIVISYLVSRLIFIGNFPYFFDEGLYAGWANGITHTLHDLFIAEIIGREPLLSWAGAVLVKLGFAPLVAMRWVSMLAGLATIWVVGLLGRKLGGLATGMVAAGLCVVLPMFLVHDGIGIYEPLVTLIMAIALYVELELAERPNLRTGAVLGVVFAAALLTKENTLPVIVLLPLSLVRFDFSADGRSQRVKVWAGAVAISLLGVVFAEVLLRSSGYWATYEAVRKSPLYTVRTISNVLNYPFNLFTQDAWRVFRTTMTGYVTLPLVAIGIVGAGLALRRRLRLTVVLLAWAIVPTAGAIFFTTYPFPRHFMSSLPPFIVLIAYAAVLGWRWVSERNWRGPGRAAYVALGVLALVPAVLFDGRVLAHPDTVRYPSFDDWQYVTGFPAGSPWPKVADAIRRHAVGSRVVIITPNADPSIVRELLGNSPRYVFTYGDLPLGKRAQFAFAEVKGGTFGRSGMEIVRAQHFVEIGRYVRPRPCDSPQPLFTERCPPGGNAVTLYERPGLPGT